MSNGNLESSQFVFRKNDNIGAATAEEDTEFLTDCFVDIGDIGCLLDCKNSKRVVVGRTGAGKSALLAMVASRSDHTIQLSPHTLSLNYIANNGVIQFFEEAGVNLTPFYMLLWKHILVVELLRAKYNIRTEENQRSTMNRLRSLLYKKDHIKEAAVEYLEKWGNKFWLTTEQRISEITERVEKSLSGSLDGSGFGAPLSADAARKLTSEQRSEIYQRGKRAVSEVQIRELESIIQVLNDEVFSDVQEHYYVTIDTLDEQWADDRIKYRLIKALIDTIRSFKRVENVKIIVGLRQDLLNKVLHSTTDPGFQEEKYESLYLYVKWTKKDLIRLVEERLNRLVKRRYTNKPVCLEDLLPKQIDSHDAIDYILDRTFYRPRDVILYLNDCIAGCEGRTSLIAATIKHAEEEYSHKRLQSLAYEWAIIYPNLKPVAQMFYGMRNSFELSEITREWLESKYADALDGIDANHNDINIDLLNSLYGQQGNFLSVRNALVRNLFTVGLLGIKTGPTSSTLWSIDSRLSLAPGEVRPTATIHIHPMFHRALGIRH